KDVSPGSWGTTLSVTHTRARLIQGFFNEDSDAGSGPDNATGFHQSRNLTEVYFDSHLTHHFSRNVAATFGVSELYGRAEQDTQVFSYTIPDDGGLPAPSGEGTPLGSAHLSDWRSFAGAYVQTRWNLTPRLGLLAGLRLNRTDESRD